jgi:hypothetical protein
MRKTLKFNASVVRAIVNRMLIENAANDKGVFDGSNPQCQIDEIGQFSLPSADVTAIKA